MKRLLAQQDGVASDLEALQTDVMRFVAILGLCLAAIFSLLHGAATPQTQEPASRRGAGQLAEAGRSGAAVPAIAEQTGETVAAIPGQALPGPDDAAPVAAATAPTVAEATVSPAARQSPPAPGLSLEFDSARSLQTLLRHGNVALFAKVAGRFWSADTRGDFSPAEAPDAYYQMAAETVPLALRRALGARGDARWGVTLPPGTEAQLRKLLERHEQGRLLIDEQGRVRHRPAPGE